jgi:formate dehydrogenase subunit delta
MDINNLVVMVNRIGDFYESMPDQAEAKKEIAMHISKFWEPRMREALIANLDNESTSNLHPAIRAAVKENLELLATKKRVTA